MVLKMNLIKNTALLTITSLISLFLLQLILLGKVSAAPIATSSELGNIKSQHIYMKDYPINGSNWPSRYNDGCGGSSTYPLKVFPWMGQYNDDNDPNPLGTGDHLDEVGDCSDKYFDGGTNTTPIYTTLAGPWISPVAYGGWATGGATGWGAPVDTQAGGCDVDSDVVNPSFTQKHIWGQCNMVLADQASTSALYGRINTPYTPSSDFRDLYTNGTTLFVQEFNLTKPTVDSLKNASNLLTLNIQADDFFAAYINGVFVGGSTDTAEETQLASINTSMLVEGTNRLAIQAIDKGVWVWDGDTLTHPWRNAGVAYELITVPNSAVSYSLDPGYDISEDGRTINFNVKNNDGGVSRKADGVGVTVTREVYINNFPISPQPPVMNNQQIGGGVDQPYQYTLTQTLNPADKVCAYIKVEPASGITDGNVVNAMAEEPKVDSKCVTISSRPYFRAYGNDVVVGRSFANSSGSCVTGNTGSAIKAYTTGSGAGAGAGVQFAASATDAIEKFMSASMHNVLPPGSGNDIPKPDTGLTFANSSSPSGFDINAYANSCIGDYKSLANNLVNNNIDIWKNSDFTLNVSNINTELNNHILLVEGDLTIESDISVSGPTSYSDISSIKTNLIIVRGNIYINPSVASIDGLFIAIKDNNNGYGGVINTCGSANTPDPATCTNTLTINGAFVADEVKLNRLAGDISTATPNEESNNPNIAEKFIFTPDFYLGLINTTSTPNEIENVPYDSMTSLPAVL